MGKIKNYFADGAGYLTICFFVYFLEIHIGKTPLGKSPATLISKRRFPTPTLKFQLEDGTMKYLAVSEDLLEVLEIGHIGRLSYEGKRFKQFIRY